MIFQSLLSSVSPPAPSAWGHQLGQVGWTGIRLVYGLPSLGRLRKSANTSKPVITEHAYLASLLLFVDPNSPRSTELLPSVFYAISQWQCNGHGSDLTGLSIRPWVAWCSSINPSRVWPSIVISELLSSNFEVSLYNLMMLLKYLANQPCNLH
jgi:hypothetical protein